MAAPKQPTPPAPSARRAGSWLDRPALVALNWEKIAWIVLILLAFALRLYNVGARTMSHDESLHTQYSYQLYNGSGYTHDPLMHGPFLFEITALSYFLFGASDASARLPVVLFGTGIVALMWFTRRWLGRLGAWLAGVLLAFSPVLLYHSRYIRHDIYLIFFIVLTAILAFRYLETGNKNWLIGLAVALGLSFTTMEGSFIYAIVFVGFFLVWTLARLLATKWENQGYRWPFLGLLALAGVLATYPLFEAIKSPVGSAVTSARLGGLVLWPIFLVGVAVLAVAFWFLIKGYGLARLREMRELDVMLWILTLAAPLYAAFPIKLFGGNPESVKILPNMLQPDVLKSAAIFLVMVAAFGVIGLLWDGRRYAAGLGVFYGVLIVLFTTFFNNGNGVGTGLVGSMGYWLAQQEVKRGGQPWYYYGLIVPLYEFLPLLLSGLGVITLAGRGLRRRSLDPSSDDSLTSISAPLPIRSQWLLFIAFWSISVWVIFTWAGEKMPWLSTHFTTPMCILGGWYLAERLKVVDWRGVRERQGLWLLLGLPLWIVALVKLLQLRPFRGSDLDSLSDTMGFIAALALVIGLGWVLARKVLAVGWRSTGRLAFLSLVALLALLSWRTAFYYNYVYYDYPVEPGVYAHGSPDVKIIVSQLQDISRKTVGENQLAFAYDNESTWPFEWYFRDFPNKKFFGAAPSRDYLQDAPVVLIGTENEGKVKPYLGNNYYRIPYRQIWWPKETYKDLTWQRIWDGLRDPQIRKNVLDVILYRRYQQPLADWDPSDRVLMFVRKDIANQVWDLGAAPAIEQVEVVDPFEGKYRLESATQILGGVSGEAPGQLKQPRDAAVGPEGRIYVADTGNHRIQVFNPDGSFAFGWGSFGEGDGQFNEPWGIAASADRIYVVDTWNHRLQVFTPDGQFLSKWGAFVSTDGQLGQQGVFWGPRAVAIDGNGNLLVTDTGNKRVQVFDPEGNPITQFGGAGLEPSYLDEPVGVAVGADGSIYVADAWNTRIQKFGADYQFVKEWPVSGWTDQNIFTKPYIAVDSKGTVYASDPTGWRVLVWDSEGVPIAALGQYGAAGTDFAWPNGVSIGPDDALWVTDADNNRVMRFEPIR